MSDPIAELPDDVDTLCALVLDEAVTETAAETGRVKPVRAPSPEALPRKIIEHAPPRGADGGCCACGGILRPLGSNESQVLDYVPGSFRVIRQHAPEAVLPLLRNDYPGGNAGLAGAARPGGCRYARRGGEIL